MCFPSQSWMNKHELMYNSETVPVDDTFRVSAGAEVVHGSGNACVYSTVVFATPEYVIRFFKKYIRRVFYWTAPRIFHYISFTLHFICITLHLHLKIVPRQHEMHDTSRFKCHALHLHFMK